MMDLLIYIFWIIFFMLLIQAFFTLVGFVIAVFATVIRIIYEYLM